jgi:hypothetical protein
LVTAGGGRLARCRATVDVEGGFETDGRWSLGIGEDSPDGTERLVRERARLLTPDEVLVAPDLGEGLAKGGGTQPIADGIAVDTDKLRGGGLGGTGREKG